MPAKAKVAPTPPPPQPRRWDSDPVCYLTGRAHLDKADALAAAAEKHWGCGRLRLLVSPELREKFDRQRLRLQTAIKGGQLEDVMREAERMAKAWTALDTAARADGLNTPIAITVWEVVLDDGTVAAIVQDDMVAKEVVANGRAVAVYTLEEIARLLSHHAGVVKAKLLFPGATVTRVAKTVADPLTTMPPEGDSLPW